MSDVNKRSKPATCKFADAVYAAAENACRALGVQVEEECRYCLSAFLLTSSPGAKPEVVALGYGEHYC